MSREHWPVRKLRLKDEGAEDEFPQLTPAENWGMMWRLAQDAWAIRGVKIESRLPRHVVRIKRGRSGVRIETEPNKNDGNQPSD